MRREKERRKERSERSEKSDGRANLDYYDKLMRIEGQSRKRAARKLPAPSLVRSFLPFFSLPGERNRERCNAQATLTALSSNKRWKELRDGGRT